MSGLRIGLIGANPDTGWAAGTHLPAIAASEDLSLVAACTTRAESARKAADLHGARHALTDPAALVALPDVDLVVVSVRAPLHAAMVELALAANKLVLCEWPLGTGPEQSERLAALAAQKGVPNCVGLQGFASAGALAMRDSIDRGVIGRLLSVRLAGTFNPWGATVPRAAIYLADAANGVSLASIVGGHSLHMLARIAGNWTTFHGAAVNRRPSTRIVETGVEIRQTSPDQFVASGVLACGAPASVHLSAGISGPEHCELVAYGDAGALRLRMPTIPEILPPALEQAGADGLFAPVLPDPRFRLAPESLGSGPAVNVAQLYALVARDMAAGTREAPDFAEALALRRLIASAAN